MTYLFKLTLALTLGMVAAALNWIYVSSQTQPATYVAVTAMVERGSEITQDDLAALPVPGDPARLRKSLIPYDNRSMLFGRKATRDYEVGDLVFAGDLAPESDRSQWDVIGPFELISVGERFKQAAGREQGVSSSTRGDTVTIAVDANFGEQTSRLLSVIAGDLDRQRGEDARTIVAVQVVPSQKSRAPNSSDLRSLRGEEGGLPSAPETVVYQTVSLQGIANVPVVLLEGDFIRFVVPTAAYY